MGYRFGYNGSTSSHQDWSSSTITPYGGTTVDSITDTTTTQKEITSIPSPFARMELVKEAFAKVIPGAVSGYSRDALLTLLHGTSVYHKTVSDTLDVAQIFFSYPSLADKVDILRWDRKQGITALTGSNNAVHNVVGKTLDMFRSQDAKGADPYNFSLFDDMYILRYKGPGHRQMHIIGATSPATLFFSTANDENAISKQICFGRDYAFDGAYASLEMRDPEFIAYLFAFKHSGASFSQRYPEVDKYLEAVYYVLDDQLKQRVDDISNAIRGGDNNYIDKNYEPITFTTIDGTEHTVQVNGSALHYKPLVVAGNSDFEISPTRQYSGTPPLVLPITKGGVYANLRYVNDPFGAQHTVPAYDANTLATRRLPGIGVQYPYLTVSDFLDDTIVRLSAPVNGDDFFDGNISGNTPYGYLLPILPLYFDFFSVEDLKGLTPAGHKAIELHPLAGDSIEVTLRIPVKNNKEVEYKRIYTPNVSADKANNTGAIVTVSDSYTAGLFPSVLFQDAATAHYRVALVDNYSHGQYNKCEFHSADNGFFDGDYVVRNTTCRNDLQTKMYLLEGKCFDCLRLTIVGGATGLLIPHFHQPTVNNNLSFAIDLGTTNTHIEYSTGTGSLSQPFTYDASQALMRWVCQPKDSNVVDHICGELLPAAIGDNSCHFPLRTVLCKDRTNSGINGGGTGDYVPFGNASPAFMYNKSDVGKDYNDYIPNLKWSSDDKAQENLRCYIEALLLMMRAKVLYEGGDLAKTEIRWFYPVSMSQHKRSMLVQIWDDAYKKYFNSQGATTNISESVAPYSFFQSTNSGVTDVVTIDIGGGTTDVVVANSSGAQMITSMRFAADALFGSSLLAVNNGPLNGIVKQFKAHFLQHLASIPSLASILKDKTVNDCGASAEVASFYFSLVDNEEVQKQRIQNKVDFHRLLQNDQRQKVVFYIFYCALLYHTAHLMRAKGLPAPLNIAFSGNGSKTVSVLSANKSILEEVASAIFDLIYKDVDVPRITIFLQDNPKEATCKGGLLNDTLAKDKAVSPAVLLGSDTTTLVNNQRYSDVESLFPAVVKEVGNFMDFITIKLPRKKSLNNLLGISDNDIALAVQSYNDCNMKAFVEKGVALKLKSGELNNTDIIEETLFFYPIIGWMNDISEKAYQQSQTKGN